MKQAFICDYCNFIGTEKAVKEHEPKCMENYTRRSCYTCKHADAAWFLNIARCKLGKEIPHGKIYEFCPSYERKIEDNDSNLCTGLFGGDHR